jgi:hypothetical protein
MHLALLVMLREFQQIGVRITGPHMIEYVATAAITIALLLDSAAQKALRSVRSANQQVCRCLSSLWCTASVQNLQSYISQAALTCSLPPGYMPAYECITIHREHHAGYCCPKRPWTRKMSAWR